MSESRTLRITTAAGIEAEVHGVPSAWDAGEEGDPLFELTVRLPGTGATYRLQIDWPRDGMAYAPLPCRIRRLLDETWAEGCIDLRLASVALFCDHAASPHQPVVVALPEQLAGMPEAWSAFGWGGDPEVGDLSAWLAERLAPIAGEVAWGFARGGALPAAVDTPFTFDLRGGEWDVDEGALSFGGDPVTEVSCSALPVPGGDDGDGPYPWSDHDVYVEGVDADHGWFTACGNSGRPGGDWTDQGWATWADGTMVAIAGCDDFPEDAPVGYRITLPGIELMRAGSPERWVALMRAMTIGGTGYPGGWSEPGQDRAPRPIGGRER